MKNPCIARTAFFDLVKFAFVLQCPEKEKYVNGFSWFVSSVSRRWDERDQRWAANCTLLVDVGKFKPLDL